MVGQGPASHVPIRIMCAELLQRWYYWKLLEFFKAASELSGEGSLLSILVRFHIYTLKMLAHCPVHATMFSTAPDHKLVVQAFLIISFDIAMSLCVSWGPCHGNNLGDLRDEVETLLPRAGPSLE